MTLPVAYIILLLSTVVLFFTKKDKPGRYKKMIMYAHFTTLVFVLADIYLAVVLRSSFRGILSDRLFLLVFLISGAAYFALYHRSIQLLSRVYFGIYFFYPAAAALTFIANKLVFIMVAGPLILLYVPRCLYSGSHYDIRSTISVLEPRHFDLVEKNGLIEKRIGWYSPFNGNADDDYTSFRFIKDTGNSVVFSVNVKGKEEIISFGKR